MNNDDTEFWLKLSMIDNIEGENEIYRFKINSTIYYKIIEMLNAEEHIINGENYVII